MPIYVQSINPWYIDYSLCGYSSVCVSLNLQSQLSKSQVNTLLEKEYFPCIKSLKIQDVRWKFNFMCTVNHWTFRSLFFFFFSKIFPMKSLIFKSLNKESCDCSSFSFLILWWLGYIYKNLDCRRMREAPSIWLSVSRARNELPEQQVSREPRGMALQLEAWLVFTFSQAQVWA